METHSRDKLLLVMRQQKARYAVPAENVEEIITSPEITVLPQQPGYIRGIFDYKGHIVPVLSLRALCGCPGEAEPVCAVLRMGKELFALSADDAESLVTDTGQRMKSGRELLEGELLSLEYVLPGEPAVFVINLEKTYENAGARLKEETAAEQTAGKG